MKKNIIDIINNNFSEEEQILLLKELVKELKEEKSNIIDDTNQIIDKINIINEACEYLEYQPRYIFEAEKVEDFIYKLTYKNVSGGGGIFPNTAKGNRLHQEYLQNHRLIKSKADNLFDKVYYVNIDNLLEKTYDEYESGYPKVASIEARKNQIISYRKNQIEEDISNKNKATITIHCPQNIKTNSKVYTK